MLVCERNRLFNNPNTNHLHTTKTIKNESRHCCFAIFVVSNKCVCLKKNMSLR